MAGPFSACTMAVAPSSAARWRPAGAAVVGVVDARVGHEELEAGDALLVDELAHRLQRGVVHVADDLVEAVVDGAAAVGLGVPGLQRACTTSPWRCTAKSTMVVVPPHAAASAAQRRRCRRRSRSRTGPPCGCARPHRRGPRTCRPRRPPRRPQPPGPRLPGASRAATTSPSTSTSIGTGPVAPTTVPLAMSVRTTSLPPAGAVAAGACDGRADPGPAVRPPRGRP